MALCSVDISGTTSAELSLWCLGSGISATGWEISWHVSSTSFIAGLWIGTCTALLVLKAIPSLSTVEAPEKDNSAFKASV